MRVIVLTHGGAEIVLERLAAVDCVEIVGVFVETVSTPRRGIVERLRRSIRYDGLFGTVQKVFRKQAGQTRDVDGTAQTADRLGLEVHQVDDFHSQNAVDLMSKAEADLSVIYGTNIIKEDVFSIPKLGSINLHQGLAPYYRGGPPIFWELFNGEKEVGITVHFVAAAVDAGDIIRQKTVPLEFDRAYGKDFEKFIADFRTGLREESANLMAESVELIARGNSKRQPQDALLGRRYRLPLKKEKDEMRRRLSQRNDRGSNVKG